MVPPAMVAGYGLVRKYYVERIRRILIIKSMEGKSQGVPGSNSTIPILQEEVTARIAAHWQDFEIATAPRY